MKIYNEWLLRANKNKIQEKKTLINYNKKLKKDEDERMEKGREAFL